MKVCYAEATNCPHGQFVVTAETDDERALLRLFVTAPREEWKPWLHGCRYELDHPGVSSLNFGWTRKERKGRVVLTWDDWETTCKRFHISRRHVSHHHPPRNTPHGHSEYRLWLRRGNIEDWATWDCMGTFDDPEDAMREAQKIADNWVS